MCRLWILIRYNATFSQFGLIIIYTWLFIDLLFLLHIDKAQSQTSPQGRLYRWATLYISFSSNKILFKSDITYLINVNG